MRRRRRRAIGSAGVSMGQAVPYRQSEGELPTREPLPATPLGFELIARQADEEFLGSALRQQPEVPFCHYTTAGGFAGILGSETIWATDYRKLSDPDELTRGEAVIQGELNAMANEHTDATPAGWLARRVQIIRHERRLIDIPGIQIFVASFSSEPDLLGQIREYADKGQGYVLCFNTIPLPTGTRTPSRLASSLAVDFGRCIYDEANFRAQIRGAVEYVARGLQKYSRTYMGIEEHQAFGSALDQWERLTDEAYGTTLARLATLVPFLKDSTYAEEREWRLVFLGTPPQTRTRPTPFGDAAYIEVSLKTPERMDLHEVVAGPRVTNLDFARSTLDRWGYGHVPVRRSHVPYR
jgi:hypothetical protein